MSIRVIHIPAHPSLALRLVEIPDGETAERLHDLVNGWFQCLELNDGVFVWLNEEGKLRGLPWNERAQILWDDRYGPGTDVLVGSAVLTGGTDARGDTLGVSDLQIAIIERKLGSQIVVGALGPTDNGH